MLMLLLMLMLMLLSLLLSLAPNSHHSVCLASLTDLFDEPNISCRYCKVTGESSQYFSVGRRLLFLLAMDCPYIILLVPDLLLTGVHIVGKLSTMGQPTRPTQPSIPPESVNE